MRLFDAPLGRQIATRFSHDQQVCLTGTVITWFAEQFDSIKAQLDLINQKIQSEPETGVTHSLFKTTTPTKVALYYFNQTEDQKLAPEQQVNISSILPVYRMFPVSENLLVDTVNELLKGNLTVSEKQQWFITEFPNPWFTLRSADLSGDGTLSLDFSEVPGFTDWWSARMLILSKLIEKTVMQFLGVKRVAFVPETLFQP